MNKNKNYYYSKLSATEQKICDYVVDGLKRLADTVTVSGVKADCKSINKVFSVINLDFPELFYFAVEKTSFYTGSDIKIKLGYLYTKETIKDMTKKIRSRTDFIMRSVQSGADLLTREKIIHDSLVRNVKYAFDSVGERKNHSITGVFIDKSAVCEGYSKAFKYLCDRAGILCLVLHGSAVNNMTGQTESHAWNIIRTGKHSFCHVDVTWDSCYYHRNADKYAFFNKSDNEMSAEHFWDRNIVPACGQQNSLL